MPQTSIIVPVYKVKKYIHRCINSILDQSFTDFDLILVDDGSPDNCGKICDEYAEKDRRIHVIHKENGGLSDARNAGIDWSFEHSDSKWITFIDSDDWVHPKYLEALHNAVNETGCEISICAYEETEGDIPFVDEIKLTADVVDTESFFCEHNVNAVVAWGKLYKKEDFRTIRYPKGKLHEDEFTTYKLLFKNRKCAFVIQPLYYYYINNNSITKSDWSPRHLNQIEAVIRQTNYLKSQSMMKAYLFCIKKSLWCVLEHYRALQTENESLKTKYLPYIRRELRRILRMGKNQQLYIFNENRYLYEIAYPIEMKFYWYWQAVKSKIKRK